MVVKGTVVKTCGWPFVGAGGSEVSLLSSPALTTLVGLLPFGPGEAAPLVEAGLLSPTRWSMSASMSTRVLARPGCGEASYERGVRQQESGCERQAVVRRSASLGSDEGPETGLREALAAA
jgi:hypothetical protein